MDDQVRRRLIKGSLAAPLVLTVGTAGANGRTTFSACLAQSEHLPEPEQVIEEPDEVFRISRDVYELHGQDREGVGKGSDKADGRGRDERGPKKSNDRYILGWDNQTLYRIDESRLVPQHVDFSRTGFGRSLDGELRRTGKKIDVLAYLDDNGEIIGIAPQRNGGQWTTKRCYNSIVSVNEDDAPRRFRWSG
jgi:hypothetical protein